MNVQLLPAALKEIEVLRATGYRGAGFLLGTTIGRFTLVEQLLPMDFDRKNGGRIYDAVCAGYQERLLGVFFCRKPPFVLDCFLEDMVLVMRRGQVEVFTCGFSQSECKARLVPVREGREEKWRI
ncbi:MAG TPA: hypothetical protein VF451_07690 [Acidobacteriota bacterium]